MPFVTLLAPKLMGTLGLQLAGASVDVETSQAVRFIQAGEARWTFAPPVDWLGARPQAAITDAAGFTLSAANANTGRIPSGALTYTIHATTAWAVGDGIAVFLPVAGTIGFEVSGGPTINGGTTALTRTLADNGIGYVVLNRIAGANAYSLSGA